MPKKQNNLQPKVTNLPLPASDNPLVIDLPDGQKIVIGKMPPGSVVEVATWRGTGRPDSRTNRLMMGMNTPGANVENKEGQSSTDASNSKKIEENGLKNIQQRVAGVLRTLVKIAQRGAESLKALFGNLRNKRANKEVPKAELTSAPTTSPDVDEWLAKIIEKSEKKRERELAMKERARSSSNAVKSAKGAKKSKAGASKSKKSR